MMRKFLVLFVTLCITMTFGFTETVVSQEPEIAGTFYGKPVSKGNYFFVLKTILSFNSPWGGIPNNREQVEKRVWDDLILSYEAHRRQISVERNELDERINETLKGEQIDFNWKDDADAYARWTTETLGSSVEMFESQMRHLAQIKKLQTQIIDSLNPSVTDEEAFQEFLNERNSLSVELAEFDEMEEAQAFYEAAKDDPEFWEKKAKEDKSKVREDRSFRRPGFVTLEFLMDMWKFPKTAVYDMIGMEIGSVYPPQPIYQGYGVFKVLETRRADESEFPQRRELLYRQLTMRKKYQGFRGWVEKLKKDADMQVYIDPPPELFP